MGDMYEPFSLKKWKNLRQGAGGLVLCYIINKLFFLMSPATIEAITYRDHGGNAH